jgi:hypothetical protein
VRTGDATRAYRQNTTLRRLARTYCGLEVCGLLGQPTDHTWWSREPAGDASGVNRQNASQRKPRLFHLVRHADVSGVSGTGTVAEGVEWSDGAVALRWWGRWPATSAWEGGLDAVLAVHGHGGATVVRWLPVTLLPPPQGHVPTNVPTNAPATASPGASVRMPAATLDGRCARCGGAWPCLECTL